MRLRSFTMSENPTSSKREARRKTVCEVVTIGSVPSGLYAGQRIIAWRSVPVQELVSFSGALISTLRYAEQISKVGHYLSFVVVLVLCSVFVRAASDRARPARDNKVPSTKHKVLK